LSSSNPTNFQRQTPGWMRATRSQTFTHEVPRLCKDSYCSVTSSGDPRQPWTSLRRLPLSLSVLNDQGNRSSTILHQAMILQPLLSHRITAWLGLEVTSVGHPVQPLCQSRVTQSRLVLNTFREGDSTTSLGNLSLGTLATWETLWVSAWNHLHPRSYLQHSQHFSSLLVDSETL